MALFDGISDDETEQKSGGLFGGLAEEMYEEPDRDELHFIRQLIQLPDFKYGAGCVPASYVRRYCRDHDSIGDINASTVHRDLGYERRTIEVDGKEVDMIVDPETYS